MTTPAEKLYAALTLAKSEAGLAGRPFGRMQVVQIIDSFLSEFAKGLAKERKRANLDPRAKDVFNVYPRREGGEAAMLSISKAIATDGFETVLEKTVEYAAAVARWSWARKKSQSGSSLIPLPTTWFGNRRYLDDSKEWWEGTGGKQKAVAPVETLPEPPNWRTEFPDFVHVDKPWNLIDRTSQEHIISACQKRNSA